MGRLTCRCLNVTVHCMGGDWRSRAVSGSAVLPTSHRLHNATLHETELDDTAGVSTEHASLLQSMTYGDWSAKTCLNCDCDVVVAHTEKKRLFVCPGLLTTEEEISQVKGHPHYSRVFRILLSPDLEDEVPVSRRRASSMSFGRDDPVIRQAHAQVKQFLAGEEEAMEERVREFERREREALSRLQHKTYTQRTLLFAAIAKARRSDANHPPPSSPSSHPHTLTHSTSLPPPASDLKQSVTITWSDARPRPNKPVSDDALFSLDGFNDEAEEIDAEKEGVAFPQSDDEESGTDDSSYRDMSSVQPVIASSAPVAVPMFQKPPPPPQPDKTSAYEASDIAPSDMASSIKALALSVQDTAVFGDLPRPRVNSASKYKYIYK